MIKNINRPPDIEVLFEFNGTRKNPIHSGYRPDHLIYENYLACGMHEYYGQGVVKPDGKAYGTITFLAPEHYPETFWIGKKISFQEGSKIVGYATVERIFNPFLLDPLKVSFSVEKAKFLYFLDFPHESYIPETHNEGSVESL